MTILSSFSGQKLDNIGVNRFYGHADTCVFGTKNSGMCDCGKGFKK